MRRFLVAQKVTVRISNDNIFDTWEYVNSYNSLRELIGKLRPADQERMMKKNGSLRTLGYLVISGEKTIIDTQYLFLSPYPSRILSNAKSNFRENRLKKVLE